MCPSFTGEDEAEEAVDPAGLLGVFAAMGFEFLEFGFGYVRVVTLGGVGASVR